MSTGTDASDSRGLHVLRPPTNPADRILITIRPPPLDTYVIFFSSILLKILWYTTVKSCVYCRDFGEGNNKVVKTISALCLNGWPEPRITWASAPDLHKRLVWQE